MVTLEQVLQNQKRRAILQTPSKSVQATAGGVRTASTPDTLNVALVNSTNSSNAWAYVTGLDIAKNNAVFFLQSDGTTPYYPASPSQPNAPLGQDCDISLGAPGSTKNVTIPRLAGGRIWFSRDAKLIFQLNPGDSGAAVVEPAVTNPKDPNYNTAWSFVEFTLNDSQFFGNISYVDFVGVPISLALQNASGQTKNVPGVPPNGLDGIISQLQAQHTSDGVGWDQLVVKDSSGGNLRALSPNSALVGNPHLFDGYYQPYVDAVWDKYSSGQLQVDTQNKWGVVNGTVANGELTFQGIGSFGKPSAADIFSCSTGPFADQPGAQDSQGRANITARLAAAFNRSTLLVNDRQPAGEVVSQFYQDKTTNHYARIVHAAIPDGKGYAFPYDDVAPAEDQSVAGTVSDPNPSLLTVTFGGVQPSGTSTTTAAAAGVNTDAKASDANANANEGAARPLASRLLGGVPWLSHRQKQDGDGAENGPGSRGRLRSAARSVVSSVGRAVAAVGSFLSGKGGNKADKGGGGS